MNPLQGKQIVFLDFETYYSRADGYDLKQMSMVEYIRDSRFKVHGVGIGLKDLPPRWGDPIGLSAFDWGNTILVAHNVKFDGSILAWKYGIYPSLYIDTKSLARAVLGGRLPGYSLSEVAQYLGLPSKGELKWDGVRDLTEMQEKEMAEYCLNDVRLCRDIFKILIKEFPAGELPVTDWTIRSFTDPKLILNQNVLAKGVENEKEKRAKAIYASGVAKEVLSSNKQFSECLASRGIEVPVKTSPRTGRSTPALALGDPQFIALRDAAPELFAGRVAAKSTINETRGEALINVGRTGAFPFDVQYSGASQTHRFSGGNSAGGNPQNFPRKGFLRGAVEAPADSTLVVGDFSNIELRILAWLAQEPKLVNAIVKGTDVYSEFASLIYKKPVTKANPKERQFGKCAILGLGYGMGFAKFNNTVHVQTGMQITEEMARNVVNLYRSTYFNVTKLWELAEKTIPFIVDARVKCVLFAPYIKIEKGALVLPSGLKMLYPNLRQQPGKHGRMEWVYDTYKRKGGTEPAKLYGGKLVENICQALAGEICKLAILRGLKRGLNIVGQVHDELICVGKPEDKQILLDVMEEFIPWLPSIKISAEVGAGKNWLEAK